MKNTKVRFIEDRNGLSYAEIRSSEAGRPQKQIVYVERIDRADLMCGVIAGILSATAFAWSLFGIAHFVVPSVLQIMRIC